MFKQFLRNLRLMFIHGPEFEAILKKEFEEKLKEEARLEKSRLNLCFKHRQERNHSHFSEGNCDYCKLLKELETLKEKGQ